MAAFPTAAHDLLNLDDLLSPTERKTRYIVREFMVSRQPHGAAAAQSLNHCLDPLTTNVFYAARLT